MRTNPLKNARLQLNLTQRELAVKVGITPNAVIKYEHGLYPEPSDKIINALSAAIDGGPSYAIALRMSYMNWRYDRIVAAIPFFKRYLDTSSVAPSGGENPFISWRVRHLHISSRMEFCKLLVLHPAIVQKYEEGQMRQMPEVIWSTLKAVGLPVGSLSYLNSLGESYYDRTHHLARH